MEPKIRTALDRLEHGGWSLTIGGFTRKAMGIKGEPTSKQREELKRLMMATGLPHRRVPYGGGAIDVWDYDAP